MGRNPTAVHLGYRCRCRLEQFDHYPEAMAAPKFSVGVDADPMMVEQTIDKTLEEIIKERRKEVKGESRLLLYGVTHQAARG